MINRYANEIMRPSFRLLRRGNCQRHGNGSFAHSLYLSFDDLHRAATLTRSTNATARYPAYAAAGCRTASIIKATRADAYDVLPLAVTVARWRPSDDGGRRGRLTVRKMATVREMVAKVL
jgi:hypothetical protein